MSSSRGDYALEQEKFGLSQIEKANAEKDNLLAIAKKMAKKDLESYDDEMRKECMNKITELTSNTEVIEEIQNKLDMEKEFMMLGLRKLDGVSISKFEQKFGENPKFKYKSFDSSDFSVFDDGNINILLFNLFLFIRSRLNFFY